MEAMEGMLMLKVSGETGTKSPRTRRRFLRVLVRNIRLALRRSGLRGEVVPRWSRVLVRTEDPSATRQALTRVFGLHSVSEVAVVPFSDLEDLVQGVASLVHERVAGRTFAVRAKRSGHHPFRSLDLAVALGNALLPTSAGVDLDNPEIPVDLEVVESEAFVVIDASPGAGGLPIGTGGRAVALFSGGFDSPVAAWMTMRRGTELDLAVFDLGGCGQVDAALEVARELVTRWAPGREPRAHIVDLAPIVAAVRLRVQPQLRQVVLKRAMYRAGTLVAERSRADALVTGEALGQVSTQTLRNLAVADEAAGLPVLRPLVGMDKEEIIGRARAIGTHDASERVQEHCDISTGRVETAARLGDVATAEGGLKEAFVRAAVEGRRVVDLTAWTPGPSPEHVVDAVPEGAVVVDVRELEEGPGAGELRLPFSRSQEWAPGLDPSRTYVFVCAHGMRSEAVAHDLRLRGIDAYSLAGGIARDPHRAA
jgi:thiamine biosynthesis protein ThiI